jgi:methyl-accepting chemotaxis protein
VSERDRTDLLREWAAAMQSLTESIGSAARQSDVARHVVGPLQRQAEVIQEVLERERALQARLVRRAFAPLDAVFDLLEESGSALRSQAEAVEEAARALERVAGLMKLQADLFGRTVRAMREPSAIAKSLAGGERADQER